MRLLRIFASLGVLSLSAFPLAAQSGLTKAHEEFARFWNYNFANSKDVSQRELIRQQAVNLPALLKPLLISGILEQLNGSSPPSDETLKLMLSKALSPPETDEVAQGVASVVSTSDGRKFVIYGVSSCASCSTIWLGDFKKVGGTFRLVSQLENPLVNDSVNLTFLSAPGEPPTLLLYGTHAGDAHNRLDVRLFSVGDKMTPLWSRVDLPRGKISVHNNTISLAFSSLDNFSTEETEEVYRKTGKQLVLIHKKTTAD